MLVDQVKWWLSSQQQSAAAPLVPAKNKRRVKPTVIAHIGLPTVAMISHTPRRDSPSQPSSLKTNSPTGEREVEQGELIESLKQVQLGEEDWALGEAWLGAEDPTGVLEGLPLLLEGLLRIKAPEAKRFLATVRWTLGEWAERSRLAMPRLVEAMAQLRWLGMPSLHRRSTGGIGSGSAKANANASGAMKNAIESSELEFAMAYAAHGLDERTASLSPALHANRQRVRDLTIDWLRAAQTLPPTTTSTTSAVALRPLQNRARGIMALLHAENAAWLASLLLEQALMRQQKPSSAPSTGLSRLSKLEARMTMPSHGNVVEDDPVALFMHLVDSHRLHRAMLNLLKERLLGEEESLQQGRGRSQLLPTIAKCQAMARLGAMLDYGDDGEFMRWAEGRLSVARDRRHLLITLPWCLTLKLTTPLWTQIRAQARQACWSHPAAMAMALALPPIPSSPSSPLVEPLVEPLGADFTEVEAVIPLDLDLSLDYHDWMRLHAPPYAACLARLERLREGQQAAPLTLPLPPETAAATPKRVIRPTTSNKVSSSAVQSDEARLQGRLRFWFWWPWGPLREILEASIRWVAREEGAEQAKGRLPGLLAALTPSLLAHPRWLEIAQALLAEQIEIMAAQEMQASAAEQASPPSSEPPEAEQEGDDAD